MSFSPVYLSLISVPSLATPSLSLGFSLLTLLDYL